jgi:transcriptional regulator of acetoin/glycerol metabolism
VAIDVATSPATRAREVRRARERFVEGAGVSPGVRPVIAESWRRAAAVGRDPARWIAPIELSQDEADDRRRAHPLGRLAPLVRQTLATVSREAEHLIVLTDAEGLLLAVEGDPRAALHAAEELNLVAGARWSERAAGTNAVGTALAVGHPVQVFAAEHFSEPLQWWTCVGAPVRDPASGDMLGAIGLAARMETVHPHSLALVTATAAVLEAHLAVATDASRWRSSDVAPREATPPAELTIDALGRSRADVRVGRREIPVSQRHSEILVLLATNPEGLTGEQLAIALYGERGKPVTARSELSRLRRVLGSYIEAEPYRLRAAVRCDITVVQQRLRQGAVDEAAGLYKGQLLPQSDAPRVVELRDELDEWMRRTILASEDVEALWWWLTTPSGRDDLPAWKRFIVNLPVEDARRNLAAARLRRLRGNPTPLVAAA